MSGARGSLFPIEGSCASTVDLELNKTLLTWRLAHVLLLALHISRLYEPPAQPVSSRLHGSVLSGLKALNVELIYEHRTILMFKQCSEKVDSLVSSRRSELNVLLVTILPFRMDAQPLAVT